MSNFDGIGFAAGEVRGTRAWKVDIDGGLRSVTARSVWVPGENVAKCLSMELGGGPAVMTSVNTARAAMMSGGYSFAPGGRVWYGPNSAGGGRPRLCPCGCNQWTNGDGTLMDEADVPRMHPAPAPDCSCGFYGYQEGSNDYYSPNLASGKGPVGGVIRAYGRVALGTKGFKAEKAEILALHFNPDSDVLHPALCTLIADRYKVPIFTDYAAMLEAFPVDRPEAA